MTGIGFWKTKRQGFLLSSVKGLETEQINLLHSLKVGDRIKLYINAEMNKHNDKSPDVNLLKMEDSFDALQTAKS